MKILLHAYENSETRIRLKNLIEEKLPEVQMVLTHSKQHLSIKLCRPLHNFSALIAFLDDSESASILLSLKPFFENIKIILVICKNSDGLKESSLLLEPLFTKFNGNNFMDVISILNRIQQKQDQAVKLSPIIEKSF